MAPGAPLSVSLAPPRGLGRQLLEEVAQGPELPAQLLHPLLQPLVLRRQLQDLVLRLHVADLGLVPALAHGDVVALPALLVLVAVLVQRFLVLGAGPLAPGGRAGGARGAAGGGAAQVAAAAGGHRVEGEEGAHDRGLVLARGVPVRVQGV